jgi:hypothetical protein
MQVDIQHGHHLLVTISQLWPHLYQVNGHSQQQVLLLASYHEDIIFHEVLTSTEVEADMDLTEMILDNSYGNKADLDVLDKDNDLFSWDQLIPDDDD